MHIKASFSLRSFLISALASTAFFMSAQTATESPLNATSDFDTRLVPGGAYNGDIEGYTLQWKAETQVNAGSGDFAPRLVTANNGGLTTQPIGILENIGLWRPIDLSKRFSYSYGVDAVFDATKATSYRRWDDTSKEFYFHNQRPAYVWLQELYAEVKFRGVYLFAGMKENTRSLFDSRLGSGDITLSNNARPIPQVRAGFIDFQNIPLTNGWVQIQGDIAYGKFVDNKWLENHYNYYNQFLTTGAWYHYKRAYFRTNPDQPFSVTVGMQHACQFGGYWQRYDKGELYSAYKHKIKFRDFIDVFYQTKGNTSENPGESVNFLGNHLGSWDVKMRYRFRNGSTLTAYLQKPWEDESGIAWQNGFDGVWGLEYKSAKPALLDAANLEYLDFSNHGGPMLWDPNDAPDSPNKGKATGGDDYYNNFMYNGWANYGLAIGSPAFKSPIYNRNGYLWFEDTHFRGFHLGAEGQIKRGLRWRMLLSYLSANGTPQYPRNHHRDVTSLLLEGTYKLPSVRGLSLKGQISFDAGSLYRPAFGVFVSACYSGALSFNK